MDEKVFENPKQIKLKLMTWNILAQRFWQDAFPFYMEWEDRLKTILGEINDSNPDIICLQEVELATASDDFSSLFDKYDYTIHKVSKKRSSPIGNMTLWKKKLFILSLTKFNSTGVHVALIHNESNKKLWLSNIHLRAGLKSQEDERISQLKSTLKFIDTVRKDGTPCCIIGDFNDDLNKDRKLYKLLTEDNLVCNISPNSCYVYREMWSKHFFRFDHIVTTPEVNTNCMKIPKLKPIPDKKWPSDHFSINYTITLNSIKS
jgi:mRNA deadenylase 3'-5' endonuclease subunit Ccr4